MLEDERSTALVTNFFFQWLDLRGLEKHTPDPNVFPGFDEQLRRAMGDEVTKLLIYALGRGLETSDQCVVEDMVLAAKDQQYRLSSMIAELVTSIPFTHRRNPDY